jgi:hypothetical protein
MPMSEPGSEGPPPILGSWKRVYVLVLGELLLCILLFHFFSRACS